MTDEKTKPRWTKTQIQAAGQSVLLVVMLILGALGYIAQDAPVGNEATARGTTTNFTDLDLSGTLTVDGASTLTGATTITGATTLTGASTHTGAVTAASTMAITGNTTVSGNLIAAATNITITSGYVLTPTATVYGLDSGGAVTMTLAASAADGQLLFLIGDDANTITVNDTNVRTSDGNSKDIGQYDVAVWIYKDSEWHQLLLIANS